MLHTKMPGPTISGCYFHHERMQTMWQVLRNRKRERFATGRQHFDISAAQAVTSLRQAMNVHMQFCRAVQFTGNRNSIILYCVVRLTIRRSDNHMIRLVRPQSPNEHRRTEYGEWSHPASP